MKIEKLINIIEKIKKQFSSVINNNGCDCTYFQYRVMNYILKNPGCIVNEIAKNISSDKATVNEVVNRLIIKGSLSNKKCKNDKRRKNLYVTDGTHLLCESARVAIKSFKPILSTSEIELLKGYNYGK